MADLNAYFKKHHRPGPRGRGYLRPGSHHPLYEPCRCGGLRQIRRSALLGKSLLACHNPHSVEAIRKVVDWFAADAGHNIVYTYYNPKHVRDVYMVALRDEDGTLIGYYEKHDSRKAETMKQYDLF